MKKNLFRYELAGDVDEFSDYFWLRRFDIIKETQKGYWIKVFGKKNNKKWCAKNSLSSFAYTSKEKAKNNYICRTIKRIEILKYYLRQCESGLKKIKSI